MHAIRLKDIIIKTFFFKVTTVSTTNQLRYFWHPCNFTYITLFSPHINLISMSNKFSGDAYSAAYLFLWEVRTLFRYVHNRDKRLVWILFRCFFITFNIFRFFGWAIVFLRSFATMMSYFLSNISFDPFLESCYVHFIK